MIRTPLLLLFTILLIGCSQPPTYESMQAKYKAHKATFSMIAKMACDVGDDQAADYYALTGKSEKEDVVLELADTMGINSITYHEKRGKCTLFMSVWEDATGGIQQQFAYQYNVQDSHPFNADFHRYESIVKRVSAGKISEVIFDMKLNKHWFFSLLYRNTSRENRGG